MIRRLRRDERGAALVFVVLAMTVMVMAIAFAVEVSRVVIERELLKSATEAAALAGALQAEPWIRLQVRQSQYVCRDISPGSLPSCGWEYRTRQVQGKEVDVVPGWRSMAGCGQDGWQCPSSPLILCRGVTFPGGTTGVMTQAFDANISRAGDVSVGMTGLSTDNQQGITTVRATGWLKAQLIRVLGLDQIEYRTWSQAQALGREIRGWGESVESCW